LTWDKPCST